jgi:hypothetical protein
VAEVSNPARQVSQYTRPFTTNGFLVGRVALTNSAGRSTQSANSNTLLAILASSPLGLSDSERFKRMRVWGKWRRDKWGKSVKSGVEQSSGEILGVGIKSAFRDVSLCKARTENWNVCFVALRYQERATRWSVGLGRGRGRWGGHVGECRKGKRRTGAVETTRLVIVCSWRCRCSHGGNWVKRSVGKEVKQWSGVVQPKNLQTRIPRPAATRSFV